MAPVKLRHWIIIIMVLNYHAIWNTAGCLPIVSDGKSLSMDLRPPVILLYCRKGRSMSDLGGEGVGGGGCCIITLGPYDACIQQV